MSVYVIGDTHLSLSCSKPMDVFGVKWEDYVSRIEKNWNSCVDSSDSVVIAGDISWGMNFDESREDFRFIHSLNGKKYILKGNHDYWWNTLSKMERWVEENGFDSIRFIHNNAYLCGDIIICGSRGWFVDDINDIDGNPEFNRKILNREVNRLSISISEAKKIKAKRPECGICAFIHYPPVYGSYVCDEIVELLRKEEIAVCYYGHIHNASEGRLIRNYKNIRFELISADYLMFKPAKVKIN